MNELPQNELLSAYVDGELTADERARVEQLLAADPAARRAVDEFRAVRDRLQALPKYTVGEDLSERVLRAAERRMLGQTAAPTGEEDTPAPELRPWRSIARRFLTRRSLAWAAAAAAVALVLVFDEGGKQPAVRQEKLARAPTEAAPAAPASREAPSIQAVGEDRGARPDKLDRSKEELAVKLSEPLDRTEADRELGEGVVAGKDGAAPALDAPAAPTVAKSAAPAPTKPAAGLVAGQPTAKPEAAPGRFRGKAGETGWQMEQRARDERFASQMKRSSLAEGEVLIVRCQIRADQTPHQPFQTILTSNSIDWEGPPAVPSKAKSDAGQVGLGFGMSEKTEGKALPAKEERASDKKAADADRPADKAPAEAKQNESPAPTTAGVEAVLVEATWDQVEATVAELSKRSDVYSSVALESPPGTNVPRSLDRYNRVGGEAYLPGPGAAETKPKNAASDAEASQAKEANTANAGRRGIARALGRMTPPFTPGAAPPAALPELPPPLSYDPEQERQDAQQRAAPSVPAPATSPAPGGAPGLGVMGLAGQGPAERSAAQQIAPESTALAAEPRTYRVLFLFETAPQAAAASAPVEAQKAAEPAKQ